MNKERREMLLDVAAQLDDALDALRDVRDEEQDAFDSMPDGLQDSSRGQIMLEAIDIMDGFENDILDIQAKIEDFAKPKKKKA